MRIPTPPLFDYLCCRQSPFYIYSNPITPAEAAAAHKALQILDSAEGVALLAKLRALGTKLRNGLQALGYETLISDHPIVPKGDEEIRLQVSATQTERDIDYLLEILKRFGKTSARSDV